jgi:hypothetical protein
VNTSRHFFAHVTPSRRAVTTVAAVLAAASGWGLVESSTANAAVGVGTTLGASHDYYEYDGHCKGSAEARYNPTNNTASATVHVVNDTYPFAACRGKAVVKVDTTNRGLITVGIVNAPTACGTWDPTCASTTDSGWQGVEWDSEYVRWRDETLAFVNEVRAEAGLPPTTDVSRWISGDGALKVDVARR